MSKRKVHRIKVERKRVWGKPVWHVHCTAGDWFQYLHDKSEVKPFGDRHLEAVEHEGEECSQCFMPWPHHKMDCTNH